MTALDTRTAAPLPAPAQAPGPRRSRPDIQGLRAVAVTLVVLYHAHVPGLRGGFVGVDVFFVISGFLITGQLVRELAGSGRIRLADFYLGRVRRLLPAAAVVVVATVLATALWAPQQVVVAWSRDAVFTAFYGSNYRLAAQGVDYQRASEATSPLQHFWSLAVEEQFYVGWPLLLLVVVLLSRRWWRRTLPVVLALGTALSFVVSERLVHSDAPLAFFSTQSRAWELGAGALLALAAPALARTPAALAAAMSWLGLAVVLVAAVCFGDSTPFPGAKALVPVYGAVLLVAAGCRAQAVGAEPTLLARRPFQAVGSVSYPWYLWHFPLVVLAPLVAPSYSFTWPRLLEMSLLALWLATLTHLALGTAVLRAPLRRAHWAAWGVGLSAGTVAVALLVGLAVQPSGTGRPVLSALATQALLDPSTAVTSFGAVVPTVAQAGADTPAYPSRCIAEIKVVRARGCLQGADGAPDSGRVSTQRVVLLGDSHAGEWYDPLQAVAGGAGLDTEVLTKVGCPLSDNTVVNPLLERDYTECTSWRASALRRLLSEPRPRAVFVAQLDHYGLSASALDSGWSSTLAQLRQLGAPIVYLRDTPKPVADVPTCLSTSLDRWAGCAFPRTAALGTGGDVLASGDHGLAGTVSVDDHLCPGTGPTCPAVLGGVLLYRDDSHVTRTAMLALTPVVRQQVEALGVLR